MSEQTPLHDPLVEAFEGFRGDALPMLVAPGPDAVRGTVRRRRRNRAVAIAGCAVLALVGGGLAATAKGGGGPADRLRPANPPNVTGSVGPSGTPTASASTTPGSRQSNSPAPTDLRAVDWPNATIPVSQSAKCPGGRLTFAGGAATAGPDRYVLDGDPAYGDLDGDGRDEAVLRLSCGAERSSPRLWELVAVGVDGQRPRGLGAITAENPGVRFTAQRITGGVLTATVVEQVGGAKPRSQTRRYRWGDGAFRQVGGPTAFPDRDHALDVTSYDWSNAALRLPFTGSTVAVQPNNQTCPTGLVRFRDGAARGSGCTYQINVLGGGSSVGDLNGDGVDDVLVEISAGRDLRNGWLFAYTVTKSEPALIGFVTASALGNPAASKPYDVELPDRRVAGGQVSVEQFLLAGGQRGSVTRTFRWNGSRFVPDRPVDDPRVDQRP